MIINCADCGGEFYRKGYKYICSSCKKILTFAKQKGFKKNKKFTFKRKSNKVENSKKRFYTKKRDNKPTQGEQKQNGT